MYQKRSPYPGLLACALAGGVGFFPRLCAQEALREALESDAAARLRNEPVVRPAGDVLRWGPATFDISLRYSLEATDNSTFVETDRQKDLIQRPLLMLGVHYQLSPRSRLDFRTGVGYE